MEMRPKKSRFQMNILGYTAMSFLNSSGYSPVDSDYSPVDRSKYHKRVKIEPDPKAKAFWDVFGELESHSTDGSVNEIDLKDRLMNGIHGLFTEPADIDILKARLFNSGELGLRHSGYYRKEQSSSTDPGGV